MSKYNLENEYSIRVSGLIAACVKKINVIIICAIVCALAVTAFAFNKVKTENAQYQALENMTIDEFSEQDKSQAEQYYGMEKTTLSKTKYVENSYYMHLDGSQVTVSVMQFAFESDKADTVTVGRNQIANYISSGSLATDIASEHEEYVAQYLQDIIVYTADDYLIKFYGNSIEENQKLGDIILATLEKKVEKLGVDNACIYSLTCVSKESAVISDNTIITNQSSRRNELLTINNSKLNIKNTLTETQLRLVDLIHQRDGFEGDTMYYHEPAKVKKWLPIAGLLFGMVLGVFLIFMQYYFSTAIKEVDAVKSVFEIAYWGGVKDRTTKNSWLYKKIIKQIPNSAMEQDVFNNRLSKISFNNGIDTLNVVGAGEYKDYFSKDTICFIDKDNFSVLAEGSKVLVLVRVNKTKWSEIRTLVEEIQLQNCEVVGYITIS